MGFSPVWWRVPLQLAQELRVIFLCVLHLFRALGPYCCYALYGAGYAVARECPN